MRCAKCLVKKPKCEFTFTDYPRNVESRKSKCHLCHDCQRTALPPLDYATRNLILRGLGYESYGAYLASPCWTAIRLRVLKLKDFTCECCGGRATQVHHNVYGRRELLGSSLRGMKALCESCHKAVEFADGRKTTLREAGERFYAAV